MLALTDAADMHCRPKDYEYLILNISDINDLKRHFHGARFGVCARARCARIQNLNVPREQHAWLRSFIQYRGKCSLFLSLKLKLILSISALMKQGRA